MTVQTQLPLRNPLPLRRALGIVPLSSLVIIVSQWTSRSVKTVPLVHWLTVQVFTSKCTSATQQQK